ncbi:hypothetical protein ABW19_dt0205611 [Dactylella cylindrospora]|nr:hypothetical protein ABW19_dt0205611 [Dactylella cylindrospora]
MDGTCVGSASINIYGGLCAGHIALDLLTIIPPIPVIAKMPMSKTKKLNLYILLGLGVVTIIFTSVRMFVCYRKMVNSFDLTRNAVAIGFWSIMESSLAVTIACLPALNHSILKLGRKLYGTRRNQRPRNKHGVIRLEGNIYKGHAKYVSYSADATAQGTVRSYVELTEQRSRSTSEEQLTRVSGDMKTADSYPDITVERTFHISEERASVLESEEAQRSQGSVSRPPRACIFGYSRRTSPPTTPDEETASKK